MLTVAEGGVGRPATENASARGSYLLRQAPQGLDPKLDERPCLKSDLTDLIHEPSEIVHVFCSA
jgi:hypothetical protein